MAVLIKGIEMPKYCADCYFMDFSASEGNHCGITRQFVEEAYKNRLADCPLAEASE